MLMDRENTKHPYLPKAPIIEAIIEIRANSKGEDWNHIEEIEGFTPHLESLYPNQDLRFTYKSELNVGVAGPTTGLSSEIDAIRYKSEDGKDLVLLLKDGIVISRLALYEGWDDLQDKWKKSWSTYCKVKKPKQISRLGVRFINKIDIPSDGLIDLREYFTSESFLPIASEKKFYSVSHTCLFERDSKTSGGSVICRYQARSDESNTDSTHASFIIDIDVYKPEPFGSQSDFQQLQLVEVLSELRDIKNEIFFESLTDKCKEMYK